MLKISNLALRINDYLISSEIYSLDSLLFTIISARYSSSIMSKVSYFSLYCFSKSIKLTFFSMSLLRFSRSDCSQRSLYFYTVLIAKYFSYSVNFRSWPIVLRQHTNYTLRVKNPFGLISSQFLYSGLKVSPFASAFIFSST